MTKAIEKRLEIADRVAKAVGRFPEVRAACASGSVALGLADEESDVDLAFICSPAIPGADARRTIYRELTDADAEIDVDVLGRGSFDCLPLEGVQVEPEFHTVRELQHKIALALKSTCCERQDSFTMFGRSPYAVLADVHYWRILFDSDAVVSDLKRRVACPETLRRAILRQGRFLDDPHIINEHERACLRGDAVYAMQCQSRIAEHVVQIAFALNRTYPPGDKWSLHLMDRFDRLPVRFHERFYDFIMRGNDAEGLSRKNQAVRSLFKDLRDMARADIEGET